MKKKHWLTATAGVLVVGLLATTYFVRADPKPEAPAIKTANNRIVHVTVYQNNALVTREVDVPDGNGLLELVVTALPPQTVNTSLYSEGSDGVRILSTRFRNRPVKADTREEVQKLEAQQRELAHAAQKMQGDIETLKQNVAMLGKLENFTGTQATQGVDKGKLDGDQIIALSDYVMKQRAEKNKEVITIQQQLELNKEQADFVKRQLQELTAGTSKMEREAVIVVDKKNGGASKVRLNYLVDSASWRPQYKFRAGKDEKEQVQIEYLAGIVQQTGEDWGNCNLTLSTAQPLMNSSPPELRALDVAVMPRDQVAKQPPGSPGMNLKDNFDKAQGLRQQSAQEYNQKKTQEGGRLVNDAAALEQTNEILWTSRDELLAARLKGGKGGPREGQSVTYHLATRYNVPSRNEEQVIEVTRIDMPPDYFFKAIPVLSPHVYRLANLTNKSKYVLLPGEATTYIGTDFVGRMDLPLVAIGEQFTAGFGVDPQLQVTRQMMDKNKTMQGGNQVLKYDYRILVSSYKETPVRLQLWERLPRAEVEAINVSILKTTPEISSDSLYVREEKPQNLLRWDLDVKPGTNGEKAMAVSYEFKLELDKQMGIGSFQSK